MLTPRKEQHPPPQFVVSPLKRRNKRRSVLLGCFAVVALLATASPAGAVAGYGDVADGQYYTEPVQWSVDNNITGIDGNVFAPDAVVTRGEASVYMWNMQNQPTAPAHRFEDVTVENQN
ncbi:MAG: S-layer homology domain-containing protein, partial [Acidimicrobiia bacterium]|nr:S-layer homology domain-containing protein [Acidimicrobiia bacterium]